MAEEIVDDVEIEVRGGSEDITEEAEEMEGTALGVGRGGVDGLLDGLQVELVAKVGLLDSEHDEVQSLGGGEGNCFVATVAEERFEGDDRLTVRRRRGSGRRC